MPEPGLLAESALRNFEVYGFYGISVFAEDDEGRWWTLLADAADPGAVLPGAVLVAGTDRFWSVVRIEQVDPDGQVHFVAVALDDPAATALLDRSAA